MSKLIKENKVLIIGILLPFVMVILFALASIIPSYFVAPPQYNVVFAINESGGFNNQLQFNVVNGKLQVQFVCDADCIKFSRNSWYPRTKLYLFDVKARQAKEIQFTLPAIAPNSTPFVNEIQIPELMNLTLDARSTSPDGYKFIDNVAYYSSNVFTDLFFNNHGRRDVAIEKNSYSIILLPNTSHYYYGVRFIGWVVATQGK